MALTDGDPVLPRSVAYTAAGTPVLSGGPVVFSAGAPSSVTSTTGFYYSNDPAKTREVAPGDPNNFGRRVRVPQWAPDFSGVVIAALQVELPTTGGTGALQQCVLVQGQGVRFLARVVDVEFEA